MFAPPLTSRQRRNWRSYVQALRDECPAHLPVRVRLVDRPPEWGAGVCHKRPDHYSILIRRTECWQCMIDSLIHEWAHALHWEPMDETEDDHDSAFGVAFARCYRVILRKSEALR